MYPEEFLSGLARDWQEALVRREGCNCPGCWQTTNLPKLYPRVYRLLTVFTGDRYSLPHRIINEASGSLLRSMLRRSRSTREDEHPFPSKLAFDALLIPL